MRTLINAAGLVLLVAVMVIFCVLNIERVDLHFLFPDMLNWELQYTTYALPLCALILVPLGCGIVLGCLLDAIKIFRLTREVRALKKELALRPLPGPNTLINRQ